jgi:type I restriction enzyme S subunit
MAKEYLIGDFLKRIKRPIQLIEDQEYKLVTIKMNHNGIVLREYKKGALIKSNMYEVKKGDFILSGIDARNGAFGIVPPELDGAIVTNDFWYFNIDESVISKSLFLELTATTWFDDICKKGSDGTTQRIRLQKDKFFNQSILLPEGNEQKELLVKILSFKIGQSKLDFEIQTQRQLLIQLKQSILQEAIKGKLTVDWRVQNSNTEPASTLLKRIKKEKAQLIKDKKIQKEKTLPPINIEEIPFELPNGWVHCYITDLIRVINGKAFKPEDWSENGIPIVRIQNLNNSNSKYNYCKFEVEKKYLINNNDLLVAWSGTPGTSFGAHIWQQGKAVLNQHIFKCPIYGGLNAIFIKHLINSKLDVMIGRAYGAAGLKHIKKGDFESIIVQLPPLNEQHLIAEKIDMWYQKITALEDKTQQNMQSIKLLMQSVLKESFETKKEVCQN